MSLIWLVVIGLSAFIFAAVPNGAATMWILAAMPMVGLTINRNNLNRYMDAFLAVIVLFAFGLILQVILQVHYTTSENYISFLHIRAPSWPVLDPNNAAVIINVGLISSFYMAVRSRISYMYIRHTNRKWWGLVALFAITLVMTASKAGLIAAFIACSIIVYSQFGILPILLVGLSWLTIIPYIFPYLERSFNDRLSIWFTSAPLLNARPLTGLGLGTFFHYYEIVKAPKDINVFFVHNDILQFAIEMGIPAAFVFYLLTTSVIFNTNKYNIVSACVLLVIFLQSMVEFVFYVPAISILGGAALAFHRLNYEAENV